MDTQLARATESMREMILRGRLKPGQRVTEVMLAQLLGMSRTPVRQALPVLAREGLLVESGTRGYLVRTFTRGDILDAIDLRGVLEGFAVRRIASGAHPRGCSISCEAAWKRATGSFASAISSTPTRPPLGP